MDSGASFHVHIRKSDLINVRPCRDTVTGLGSHKMLCPYIGDLPISYRDSHGAWHYMLIRNVRYVTGGDDSIVSFDQMMEEQGLVARFELRRFLDPSTAATIPFERLDDGLFVWRVATATRDQTLSTTPNGRVLSAMGGIHRGHVSSHIDKLSVDRVAAIMHLRLHAGTTRLRQLPKLVEDAPGGLAHSPEQSCPHCTTANATHLPHGGSRYVASRPGLLVHGDTVGPFLPSREGYRYALILVDDHTRFKFVYFLREKSDALKRMQRFAAEFNAHGSTLEGQPTRSFGSFHSDNAGEFVSHEFREFLDNSRIAHTTSPPHASDLNGVAERAIRSASEGMRANIVAANAPKSFWPQAMAQSVDVLNRTTCPPLADTSSYEMMTGVRPKIMHIMPFGCAAWAVKPKGSISKTAIESKAWEGINLGCSPKSPGGYLIWVPSINRVVNTADAYFAESHYPWRAKGDQFLGDVAAQAVIATAGSGAPQPPGVPSPSPVPASPAPATAADHASTLHAAFASATAGAQAGASASSRSVLVLFSGPYNRPDGLRVFLEQAGFDVTVADNDGVHGGGPAHDLLTDSFFDSLVVRVRRGEFYAIIAAPPCSTFSV